MTPVEYGRLEHFLTVQWYPSVQEVAATQHWIVGHLQHGRHLLLLQLVRLLGAQAVFVPDLPVVLPYVRFLNALEDDWRMPMKQVVAEINIIKQL